MQGAKENTKKSVTEYNPRGPKGTRVKYKIMETKLNKRTKRDGIVQ